MQRLEVSIAVRPLYGSLGVKGLTNISVILSPNAFFPTMPRNLGRHVGADNCSNLELKFDLHLFDILSRTPASGVCANCPNFPGFTAMRITGNGLLLPHTENWMDKSVCSTTGYTPSELMSGTERPNVFRKMVQKESWSVQEGGGIEKIRRAYVKMKKRAMTREKRRKRGNAEWNPELNEKVLVKTQPMSDAVRGITSKFLHLFQGPYGISKDLGHSAYEIRDELGKIRGEFNKKQLKRYKEEPHTQTKEAEKHA